MEKLKGTHIVAIVAIIAAAFLAGMYMQDEPTLGESIEDAAEELGDGMEDAADDLRDTVN